MILSNIIERICGLTLWGIIGTATAAFGNVWIAAGLLAVTIFLAVAAVGLTATEQNREAQRLNQAAKAYLAKAAGGAN